MSQGGYTHITRASGTILTAAIYNNDHQNHITNQNPLMTGAYSDTLAQFQLVVDPGPIGSENLPNSLAGEIERLRWQIRAITGEAQWNHPPSSNLKGVAGTPDGGVPLQKLAYTTQGSILMRTAAGTGAWQSSTIGALSELSPSPGDWVLGVPASGGAPRKIDVRNVVSNPGVIAAQGRLTLTTAQPFTTGNILGSNAIRYTPYTGLLVPTWNGTTIVAQSIGAELSQLTTDNTKSPAAALASRIYDIFFWMDTGNTPRISRGFPWASNSSRGAPAALTTVGGILVNNVDITNGPLAQRGTYLGSVWTNGSATIDYCSIGGAEQGRPAFIGIYNHYHRQRMSLIAREMTPSFNIPAGGGWSAPNGNSNNSAFILSGQEQDVSGYFSVGLNVGEDIANSLAGNEAQSGIGQDGTGTFMGTAGLGGRVQGPMNAVATFKQSYGPSAHSFQMLLRTVPGGPVAYIPAVGYGQWSNMPCCAMTLECWY